MYIEMIFNFDYISENKKRMNTNDIGYIIIKF